MIFLQIYNKSNLTQYITYQCQFQERIRKKNTRKTKIKLNGRQAINTCRKKKKKWKFSSYSFVYVFVSCSQQRNCWPYRNHVFVIITSSSWLLLIILFDNRSRLHYIHYVVFMYNHSPSIDICLSLANLNTRFCNLIMLEVVIQIGWRETGNKNAISKRKWSYCGNGIVFFLTPSGTAVVTTAAATTSRNSTRWKQWKITTSSYKYAIRLRHNIDNMGKHVSSC